MTTKRRTRRCRSALRRLQQTLLQGTIGLLGIRQIARLQRCPQLIEQLADRARAATASVAVSSSSVVMVMMPLGGLALGCLALEILPDVCVILLSPGDDFGFRSCDNWQNAWAMGLLFCDADAELPCGMLCCNVAKSDCATGKFALSKSCPSC